jgi:hypothetical protein
MSEGGHDHGGDMGGQPSFFDPGLQPGVFPPPEPYHIADSSGLMPPGYGRRRRDTRRYRPRAGSPGWVVVWIVRLALLAFIVYVAFQVFHGMTSTPSP